MGVSSPGDSADQVKRAFDIVVSGSLLLVLSPVIAVVAAAIAAERTGPVFFTQDRIGLHGKPFRIHKFRSMRASSGGPEVTTAGDARVTRVGALLRKSKLDEIPQLFDVLMGTMSLVGPRPEVARYVELWPEAERELILSVRPGITDPASIAFRNESELLAEAADPELYYREVLLPAKVEMYAEYVRTRSLLGDLRVLISTAWAVVARG
ncbi:MAG TPA: sugar transferase [Dermatophilaceae bacterium]|mgnify:CR=1 FL=1|jgi:lipopolysaccharide/colanic/teichoic acid biosynthesis glycosyltransferase|nr:sugar transferase [Dermatophilaceae bacterium]